MCWVCCPAWCSVAGSTLLWASGRGLTWVLTQTLLDESINGLVCAHMHSIARTQKIRLHGWCMLGVCVFFAGIYLSRTWMSGSFESVHWNACVHRLDRLHSHPKEWGNGVRTHVNSKGKIPSTEGSKEDQTHNTVSRRTANPTHYQLSYSGPCSIGTTRLQELGGGGWGGGGGGGGVGGCGGGGGDPQCRSGGWCLTTEPLRSFVNVKKGITKKSSSTFHRFWEQSW